MGLFSKATPEQKRNRVLFSEWNNEVVGALQEGADPNCTRVKTYSVNRGHRQYGFETAISPLFHAVCYNYINAAQTLIASGADPNFANNSGINCLMLACSKGRIGLAQKLLNEGADPNAADEEGWTPLHYAVASPSMRIEEISSVVQLLIKKGAAVGARNKALQTPADLAKERNYTQKIAQYLENRLPDMPAAGTSAPEKRWYKTEEQEITLVSEKPAVGYRLTEIFNFEKGTYIEISRNLETNAECQSLKTFEEFSDISFLEKARQELLKQDGKPSEISRPRITKGPAA